MTSEMPKALASAYPGAPLEDRHAFQVRRGPDGQPRLIPVGRQLRDQAVPLVLTALELVSEDAPARAVCRQANRIKALTPDLDDRRFMSIDTCRRVLRRLAAADEAA